MSLSKLQKAVAFAGLATTPVSAQAGVSSISAAVKIDNHTKQGQSDARGDEKGAAIVLRTDDGKVFGIETGIYTPQFGRNRAARDTASIIATLGRETEQDHRSVGIYGSVGYANGIVLNQWHSFVNARHDGHARTSPASSQGRVVLGVVARVDEDRTLASIGNANIDLNGAVFGTVGTTKAAVGAGAFISLNGGGQDAHFRPTLPDMPLRAITPVYSLYAGMTVSARAYDLATDKLGTETFKTTAVLGAQARLGRLNAGIEFQKDLSPEIKHRNATPVGRTMMRIGFDF